MKRFLIYSTAFVMVLGLAAIANAGEVGGHNIAQAKKSIETDLGNGKMFVTTGNHTVCRTTDANHPLNDASGDCDGGCVMNAEGDGECLGSCTWADKDGDLAFFTWSGVTSGTWKFRGGTGKYAEATGKGTWETSGVYAGGMVRNSWSGAIEMK